MKKEKIEVRERVLKSARNVFFEKGFYASTTRELAAAAKTSESGIYRHFPSKYKLLMGVYNDCWGEVNKFLFNEAGIDETQDPREKIKLTIKRFWGFYDKKPLLMSFIIINTGNTDTLLVEKKSHAIISKENMKYIERIEKMTDECVAAGLVDPGYTARSLCEGILGLTEGILLGWYLADKSDGAYPDKVSIEDSLLLIHNLLYVKK